MENFTTQMETKINSSINSLNSSSNEVGEIERYNQKKETLRGTLKKIILQDDILDGEEITLEEWKEVFDSLCRENQELLDLFKINSLEKLKLFIMPENQSSKLGSEIRDIFGNPNTKNKVNINLNNNKPALRDFINPEDYKDFTFDLKNSRNENIKVGYKNGDWRIVKNGIITDNRALIWKGENIISCVRKKDNNEKNTQNKVEVLSDKLVRIHCSTQEAINFEKEGKIFDEEGRRIVYYIKDSKPFKSPEAYRILNPDGEEKYQKKFIAFHGTGFNEEKYGKASDFAITKSAINMGATSSDYAFLIGRSGGIYQFFDANLGFGALGGRKVEENGLGKSMNRETIAIEMALRGDGKGTYENGVERPNNNQREAGKILGDFLAKTYKINSSNFLTSMDPVRGISDAHSDDFNNEDRAFLGIPTKEEQQTLITTLQKSYKIYLADLNRNKIT